VTRGGCAPMHAERRIRLKQDYFIVVLAHSLHGRLQRVHIPQKFVYGVVLLAVFGLMSLVGVVSSYARMALKVANYNSLRSEADSLRARYTRLQSTVNQTNEQLATLQMFAEQVSVAYGIKQKLEGPADLVSEARLTPTLSESIAEYDYLRSNVPPRMNSRESRSVLHQTMVPAGWPLQGRLESGYGVRSDPFSREGAYHTGLDITAPIGTRVAATADGIVVQAGMGAGYGGYGKLVVIQHGNGYQTYFGHLSRVMVMPGQAVRQGDVIGEVGMSGRTTGPHLHYEVRVGAAPVNPYRFLNKPVAVQVATRDFPF